jgi:hypothetical protein
MDTGEKWVYNRSVHQLFIDFKKAYDLVRREVLHNLILVFWVPKKLNRLIKKCLNKMYSINYIGKHLIIFLYKMSKIRC